MENKQTAVDFVLNSLGITMVVELKNLTMSKEIIRQAKEMEKEQRKNDFFAGIKRTSCEWNGEYVNGNNIFDIEKIFKEDFEEWIN